MKIVPQSVPHWTKHRKLKVFTFDHISQFCDKTDLFDVYKQERERKRSDEIQKKIYTNSKKINTWNEQEIPTDGHCIGNSNILTQKHTC